jgi:hypothetical protein
MTLRKWNSTRVLEVVLLLVVASLVYLPGLLQATVYRDNWYYLLDRHIGGPGIFQLMFSIDRPARGPFFEAYYRFFGDYPLPYHLASFVWRFLGGLAALWLFNILWPRQRRATLLIALLFLLFPGYLRWMEGFEDQPSIASLILEVLSITLTLVAIRSARPVPKVAAWIGSILTGWAYIALVDYGIGMEIFRLLCVFMFVNQGQSDRSLFQKWYSAVRAWVVAVLIPAGFLFWRLFIFHNQRAATDVGHQLGVFVASPLSTGFMWLVRLLQSVADVAFLSWVTPALQEYFGLRLRDMLPGALLALVAVTIMLAATYLLNKQAAADQDQTDNVWAMQSFLFGLIGVVFGVLPVVMANRYVDFHPYSHYSLPASLAAAVLIVGLVYLLKSDRIRFLFILALVLSAVLTHYAYFIQVLEEEKTISAFWHQMSWRAPGLRRGTTLYVYYPGIDYAENVDAVDGPANFIYYPEPTGQIPAVYRVHALLDLSATTNDVLLRQHGEYTDRAHIGHIDYDQFLVISQPTETDCVHVIDAQRPLYSKVEPDRVLLYGQYSRINGVRTGETSPHLVQFLFGPEPAHNWCYYFEKADLALQSGEWEKVAELGDQASKAGLHPEDWVEWTPFLQAYAYLDDVPHFSATAHRINGASYPKLQACNILKKMQATGFSFSSAIQTQMNNLLCTGG